MQRHTPVISLPAVLFLTEDGDPPVQSGQLSPAPRPPHGLLPALHHEGVEAGQRENDLRQESDLAGRGLGCVERDVAGLVEADLR